MRLIGTLFFGLVLLRSQAVDALWPFQQKRFTQEAFIDAGPLGVNASGRVAAVGDWDGDQNIDLFTLSEDRKTITVQQWSRDTFSYKATHEVSLQSPVTNIVPGDYDHDGRLDLLVMYEQGDKGGWWGGSEEKTGMTVYFGGGPHGSFREDPWELTTAGAAQPIVFDADGTLRPSLLGYLPSSDDEESSPLRVWQNTGPGFSLHTPRLSPIEQVCELASSHSSAFIDIDGDCLPDLVLHCASPKSTRQYIQIWLNKGQDGYVLERTFDLPKGSGPLSFADMDRDGTIDIIFPTCARQSNSAGTGSDCSINIAYNRQVPICSGLNSETTNNGAAEQGKLSCRGWGELCVSDPDFSFSFDQGDDAFVTIPFSTLFSSTDSEPGILLHAPGDSAIPLPIRPGDYNVDGFPDLLITISNSSARHSSGVFGGSAGTQVRVIENIACRKGIAGCEGNQKRGFRVKRGKGWEVLDHLTDVTGASWIDLDDDGSLDVLVQRSGEQDEGKVTFVQNNFYHDAFFLKAQVLNGACDGDCQSTTDGKKYKALGVSYSGATYKFTVLDTLGRRVAQQSAQLPQTGYHALGTPYSFIGLGRTNNYVERLTIGASLHPPNHITDIESIVPNSQIIINPPFPPALTVPDGEAETPESPVKARSLEWHSELFLHPGDWIPWVGAAVVGTVLVLVFVVVGLNEKEKREDEKERQRALHAINFQAL